MTLQSPTATLIPLFSSSELTGCGYPGLLDRKNRSDMCPRWESNPRLPACKASTQSTRPGSPLWSPIQFPLLFIFHPSTGNHKSNKNVSILPRRGTRNAKKCILKSDFRFSKQKRVSSIFYQLYESICVHQTTFYHQR